VGWTNDLRIEEHDGYAQGNFEEEGEFWIEIHGIGKEPRHAPYEYLSALLDAAVHKIPQPQEGPFKVETLVYVKHSSPGWWDGFRVQLTGGGS